MVAYTDVVQQLFPHIYFVTIAVFITDLLQLMLVCNYCCIYN